ISGIKVDFRLPEDGALSGRHVVTIDRGRRRETSERVERLFVTCFTAKTLGRSDPGKRDFIQELARGVVNLDLRVRVLQIVENEFVVDEAARLQGFFRFADDDFPVGWLRLTDSGLDHLPTRRLQFGLTPRAPAF